LLADRFSNSLMSTSIISVENLSKRYVIGHQRSRKDGLRHALESLLTAPVEWLRTLNRARTKEEFWALKDVSFDVQQGEVVGIIGRNGAGKSTLLKVLSRITEPTRGRIRLRGRVSSLLEVGTGFHQELTGRENIFLNGAILGMTRTEIKRKFDEIVAFAETDKFIDTPVKRYSSGMYVRLAFAVAAHLEPEILIVDEVLAVGDVEFQRKCLGKMKDAAKGGRTVIFVSHNLTSLRQLCSRAVLLREGKMVCEGVLSDVIERYLSTGVENRGSIRRSPTTQNGQRAFIEEVELSNPEGCATGSFSSLESIRVRIRLKCFSRIPACQLAVRLTNLDGVPILTTTNVDGQSSLGTLERGDHLFEFKIPEAFLAVSHYSLIVCLHIPGVESVDTLNDVLSFDVVDGVNHATRFHDYRRGVVTPLLPWKHRFDNSSDPISFQRRAISVSSPC
jgi:homopolymeric O-antigen transport system ATP-binding protein